MNFAGEKIIVTGAGKGIGEGLTRKLVSLGAHVYAVSRTESDLIKLKNDLGDRVTTITCDISNWDLVEEKLGGITDATGLVNNAAIAMCSPCLEATEKEFDQMFNVNVKAMMHCSQIVAKSLIKRSRPGSIVNLSSQASIAALADHVIYGMTKAAVDQMTRVMALELGPHKIRVNAVNPTVVLTAMGQVGWSKPERRDPMIAKIPLGRFCEVDDVVGPILYYLSDLSAMVNGTTHPIDGGFLAC